MKLLQSLIGLTRWPRHATSVLIMVLSFASMPAMADDPVRVGAVVSATGPGSFLGGPAAKALELMADQINQEGGVLGRQLELVLQLGSHWRVIVQGFHGADRRGVHRLDAPAVLTPSLTNVIAQVGSEDEFASVLLSLATRRGDLYLSSREPRAKLRLDSPRWGGSARSSLLAWPTRSV